MDLITYALCKGNNGGGSGGGVLVVTDTEGTLDKTWQEIHDADFAVVKIPYENVEEHTSGVEISTISVVFADSAYGDTIYIVELQGGSDYTADAANGYPVREV